MSKAAGAETRNKIQKIPVCREKISALNSDNSEETAAVNEITRLITFLCGFDNFKIHNIEGVPGGNENE